MSLFISVLLAECTAACKTTKDKNGQLHSLRHEEIQYNLAADKMAQVNHKIHQYQGSHVTSVVGSEGFFPFV